MSGLPSYGIDLRRKRLLGSAEGGCAEGLVCYVLQGEKMILFPTNGLISHHRKFWAFCAIVLGIWEGAAVATRKIPTVTETARRARRRKIGAAAIMLWWAGLGWHLLRGDPEKAL